MTMASAVSSAAGFESDLPFFGLIVPSGSTEKSTVHLEAVPLAQDLGQHRQRFLAAVLLVAGEKHDVLPLAGARPGRVTDARGAVLSEGKDGQWPERQRAEQQHEQQADGHGFSSRRLSCGRTK